MDYRKIFQISIWKTLRFNLFYFGLNGFKLPVLISRNVRLKTLRGEVYVKHPTPAGVHIGFEGVSIFDWKNQKSIWDNCGSVSFEGKATLGQGIRIANKGKLYFGEGSRITANSSIVCYKSISFGKDSLVSWNCIFMDTDFHKIYDGQKMRVNEDREIIVGDCVWIGSESLILKGTQIAKDNVIAADTVLSGTKISENNVIAGSFGKILRRDITWEP